MAPIRLLPGSGITLGFARNMSDWGLLERSSSPPLIRYADMELDVSWIDPEELDRSLFLVTGAHDCGLYCRVTEKCLAW